MHLPRRWRFGSMPNAPRQPSVIPLPESSRPRDLEHELAPAVLDACRSLWQEFADLSALDPRAFCNDEHELLRWYAELHFRLGSGGGRCVECGAHVRHALPTTPRPRMVAFASS